MGVTGIESGHIVQNVGQVDIMFAHPRISIEGVMGKLCYLGGFRLQGEILKINQLVDNSLLVPILGGGSVQLTNNNGSGQLTFTSIRTGTLNADGASISGLDKTGYRVDAGGYYDIVSIADLLKRIPGGDDVGGSFKIQMGFNGMVFTVKLLKCTLVRCEPLILSGNDVPNYQCVFNFGLIAVEGSDFDPDTAWDEIAG